MLKQKMKSKKAECCDGNKPLYAKGLCRNCYEKQLRKKNQDFAERQRENNRRWRKKYSEKKKESDKKWRAKQDPKYLKMQKRRSLLAKYGLTIEDYNNILNKQNGVCAICGNKPKKGKNLHVDHCHENGHVRGLLCFRCNFGLSYFGENFNMLKNAYTYLKRSVA